MATAAGVHLEHLNKRLALIRNAAGYNAVKLGAIKPARETLSLPSKFQARLS